MVRVLRPCHKECTCEISIYTVSEVPTHVERPIGPQRAKTRNKTKPNTPLKKKPHTHKLKRRC